VDSCAYTPNYSLTITHGGNDPGYDNENFSPRDKANAQGEHVDSYLGTPNGTIREYDPSTIMTCGSTRNAERGVDFRTAEALRRPAYAVLSRERQSQPRSER
jgi:hypothetical protein